MFPFQKNYNFQFDSRKCNEDTIFIALENGSRSGMEFTTDALRNGAKIIISQKPVLGMSVVNLQDLHTHQHEENINIVVENSLLFMQEIARQKFDFFKTNGVKTVAITGSVGKTTTKELIKNTLEKYGTVYATQGNYNNHIGLPLTILNSPWNIDFLILEMGMNHGGEILDLVKIAPCDFSIITNAKESHAGNFENGIQGVMHTKFEVLNAGGKCFISNELFQRFLNDSFLMCEYKNSKIIPVESNIEIKHDNGKSIWTFENRNFKLDGFYSKEQCKMFVVAVKLMDCIVGEEITTILLPKIKGRGNNIHWHGINVINDSYNASFASMMSAFETFNKYNGKKLCILGEMREMGTFSREYHEKLMPYLEAFDDTILVGKEFSFVSNKYKYFENYSELLEFLNINQQWLKKFQNILVKASNGVLLWKLFEDFFI